MPSGNGRDSGNPPNPKQEHLASGELRPLSPRELEVAEWIAAAKTNPEIGEVLGCSPRTVQKHVEHILDKLKVGSRISIAVWWAQQQLNGGSSGPGEQESGRG